MNESACAWQCRLTVLLAAFAAAGSACAEVFELPSGDQDVVGEITTVEARQEDTLLDIARRHGLGYEDIVRANPGVDTWLPGEGTEIVLPTRYVLPSAPRQGIVLNLAEYRLYYYPPAAPDEPAVVMTYPISIGRMDWATPLGRTRVVAKVRDPAWYPPESIRAEHAADGDPLPRIVPPGPDNPLGDRAMRLGLPGYLIHGTNKPAGVGMRVTHGCIRMFPEDIRALFEHVPVDTPVRIINEPVKVGWNGDRLVVEAHEALEAAAPPTDEPTATDRVGDGDIAADEITVLPPPRDSMTLLTERYVAATQVRSGELDWSAAQALLDDPRGIPVEVGQASENKNAATSAALE